MFDHLVGLYWYFRYSKRIIIPFTWQQRDTLKAIALSWRDGVPQPMQFGSYVEFFEDVDSEKWEVARELIEYQHEMTVDYLATFGLFPIDEVHIMKHDGDLAGEGYGPTLGWKQTFEWKPTC